MRIVINKDDGLVGVDGVFRKVDLATLDPAIRALQFDTVTASGHLEFHAEATIDVRVRDADAEAAALELAGKDPLKQAALVPLYKTVQARRANAALADLTPYQAYLDAWTAAAPPPAPVPTLDELRARAATVVDGMAEQVRLRYITGGAGQAGTYIEKAAQADRFQAAGYPASAVPPMVQAEADATGQTPQQACDSILATRDVWVNQKGPAIERERRRGKVNIDAALDAAGVDAARDAALTALRAL